MDYLLAKFFWYVLFAFGFGVAAGWFLCTGSESSED